MVGSGEKCFVSPTNKSSNCDVDHSGVLSASSPSGDDAVLNDPSNESREVEFRRSLDNVNALDTAGLIVLEFERRFLGLL